MSLVHEIKLERDKISAPKCRVCVWASSLSTEEQLSIRDWISEGLPKKNLYTVCQANGLKCSYTTFRVHVAECGGRA